LYTLSEAPVVREVRKFIGELTEDEAALVRIVTPAGLKPTGMVEHILDLLDLLGTIRSDEATAEYVYAIAPGWDGTIETLLLGAQVTAAFERSFERVA
jgi:hypothetical protein